MACIRGGARRDAAMTRRWMNATADGLSEVAVSMIERGWVTRAMVHARALLGPGCERSGWYALLQWMQQLGYP